MNNIKRSIEKRKYLKDIIFLLLITSIVSCKKNSELPPNNNEVKATVVLSSGRTIDINATAAKALMGCASYGGGTYIAGTNETNAAVYTSVYASGIMCVTSPGTYSFDCQYRPDVTSQTTPIYVNSGGSITFKVINDHYMEGFFNAVCRSNTDSVVVNGTFKGDHLTN